MGMDPLVTGTIIQEGSGLLSSLMNNAWAQAQQAGQREHVYQMTDYLYSLDLEQWNRQNAHNLEMWNLQNQYNSPAAQMQRYKDAGLNPNLIYGQGQPGMASPVQQAPGINSKGSPAEMAKIFPLQKLDFVNTMMGIRMQDQQLQNMEAVKTQTEAETKLKVLEAALKAIELGFRPQEIEYLLDKMDFEKTLWPDEAALLKGSVKKMGEETLNLISQRGLIETEKGLKDVEKNIKQKELDFLPELQQFQRSSFPLDLQAKGLQNQNITQAIAEKASKIGLTNRQTDEIRLKMQYFLNYGIWPDKIPWYMGQTIRMDHGKKFKEWQKEYNLY